MSRNRNRNRNEKSIPQNVDNPDVLNNNDSLDIEPEGGFVDSNKEAGIVKRSGEIILDETIIESAMEVIEEIKQPEPVAIIPARVKMTAMQEADEIVELIKNLASKGIKDRQEQIKLVKAVFPEFNTHEVIGYTLWNGITRFIYKNIKKSTI